MARYRVLYYPLFEPRPTWLRSILLFVDEVKRIIPNEAKHKDSSHISRLREIITPDPAPAVEPRESDLWINQSDLELMMRAFELIVAKRKATRGGLKCEMKFEYDFVHRAKIPNRVRDLLVTHKLMDPPYLKRDGFMRRRGYISVQRDAAGLILSYSGPDREANGT